MEQVLLILKFVQNFRNNTTDTFKKFDRPIYGVMGVDVIMKYFYQIVQNLYLQWITTNNYK